MNTIRLTVAQAIIKYIAAQYVERPDTNGTVTEQRFIAGVWGIFGHGNTAGIGQAL